MKASKFSAAQKAFIIRQGEDGTPVEEVCRKTGISQATYYAKKKYAGMMPSKMKPMREREEENGHLKRIVADLSLDSAYCRTSSRETSKTCAQAQAGGRNGERMEGIAFAAFR